MVLCSFLKLILWVYSVGNELNEAEEPAIEFAQAQRRHKGYFEAEK